MAMDLKEFAKRSRALHSTVKLLRTLPRGGASALTDLSRTTDIVRVLPNTMLGLPALATLYECARTLERDAIPGDFAECGVWAGGAVGLMALVNRRYGRHARTLHLFDSFEGLPAPTEQDVEVYAAYRSERRDLAGADASATGQLVAIGACARPAYGGSTLANVTHLLDRVLKLDPQHYVIHQGWFQETVPAASNTIGPLALLRLDGDWYESIRVCLEGLYERLAPGGYLIIDDYGSFTGCTRAVDEFLHARRVPADQLTIEPWGAYLRRPSLPGHSG